MCAGVDYAAYCSLRKLRFKQPKKQSPCCLQSMAADLGRLNMLPASQSPETDCAPGFPSDAMQIDRERTPTGSPTQSSPGEAVGAAGGLGCERQVRCSHCCAQAPLLYHGALRSWKKEVVRQAARESISSASTLQQRTKLQQRVTRQEVHSVPCSCLKPMPQLCPAQLPEAEPSRLAAALPQSGPLHMPQWCSSPLLQHTVRPGMHPALGCRVGAAWVP